MTVYYKMRQILQNTTAMLLQNARYYYKMRQKFITKCVRVFIIECDSFITKCNSYCKYRRFYYKMRQLLQNTSFITNYDSTVVNKPVAHICIILIYLLVDIRIITTLENFVSSVYKNNCITLPSAFNLRAPLISKSCIKIKISLIFIFTIFCGSSKGFMKDSKAFIKPFEAPQRSVNIKI